MPFDFKKEYKEFYMPKNKPEDRHCAACKLHCSARHRRQMSRTARIPAGHQRFCTQSPTRLK